MFTKEQIEAAHSKVKSGADFPNYVKEIKKLGIISHEVLLLEGTWIFKGVDGQVVQFRKGKESIIISSQTSPEKFKQILTMHQNGETEYGTFCVQAGEAGVERWISDFKHMTVSYLDSYGNIIDIEPIPGA